MFSLNKAPKEAAQGCIALLHVPWHMPRDPGSHVSASCSHAAMSDVHPSDGDDFVRSEPELLPQGGGGKKKRVWNRGRTMTPQKRALQFPDVMMVKDGEMWCSFCHVPVKYLEKATARQHIASETHRANVLTKPKMVETPGSTAAQEAPVAPPAKKLKQGDIGQTLGKLSTQQAVAEDFVAAFLHAGLPIHKLENVL